MPGIDGYETFSRIIKLDDDARIIFTLSYTFKTQKFKQATDQCLKGILNKPFDFDDLEKMIKKHAK